MKPTTAEIQERLRLALPDAKIELLDESHLHAGHAGASGGAGHFRVRIQAPSFEGLSLVMRHRLVYDALRDWMPERIHALAIEASV
jgi:BolA family transcriptional regulator, general stress-responsive regulator